MLKRYHRRWTFTCKRFNPLNLLIRLKSLSTSLSSDPLRSSVAIYIFVLLHLNVVSVIVSLQLVSIVVEVLVDRL